MQKTFIEMHGAAAALLVATAIASVALEWVVTYRERTRTTLHPGSGLAAWGRLALSTLVETTTSRTKGDATADRETKRIVVGSMVAALTLAWLAARHVTSLAIPGSGWAWLAIGLSLMWLGIALRLWSIVVLGRFFRRDVVIQEDHEVVRAGPYRVIRHPAYAGNLIIAVGLGLALANWLSLAVLVVLPLLGHLPRIRVEETALQRSLGEKYRRYERETQRLVPGIW